MEFTALRESVCGYAYACHIRLLGPLFKYLNTEQACFHNWTRNAPILVHSAGYTGTDAMEETDSELEPKLLTTISWQSMSAEHVVECTISSRSQ